MPNQFLSPEGDIENYYVTESWMIDQYIGDQLWTWGPGNNGILGNNSTAPSSTPVTTFSGGTNWKQISVGGDYFGAGIKTDGSLWVWGRNSYGNLGINNDSSSKSTPVTTFAGGNDWRQIVCSLKGMCAIKIDGTLWSWGKGNGYGNGDNKNAYSSTPVTTFAGGNNWKQVSISNSAAGAIKTDGTLWMWGSRNKGGLGDTQQGYPSFALTPITTFAGGNDWKQVSVGTYVTGAIKTDGTLWVWGTNYYGRMGIGNTGAVTRATPVTTFAGGNNWKQLSMTSVAVAAIKTDGTLWTWGLSSSTFSSDGILGTNDNVSRSTPVTTFAGGNDWKQVSMGSNSCAAIKTDGSLWTWGNNSTGQLGNNLGFGNNRLTPITTFAGGNNWRRVSVALSGPNSVFAVTSGIDPLFSLS